MKQKEQSLFEKHGGTYSEVNGVLLLNLVSTETNYEIGAWGQRHLNYIKQHRKVFYLSLKTSCKLNSYLHEVDVRAQEMYDSLVTQLKQQQGITEQLKANNMLVWVQAMNIISKQAREIVNQMIVYAI